jgi:hypothetical protein
MKAQVAIGLAAAFVALGGTQASAGGWYDYDCDRYGYYRPAPIYRYYAAPTVHYVPAPTYRYYYQAPVYYYAPPRPYVGTYSIYTYRPRYYGGYYGYAGWRRW